MARLPRYVIPGQPQHIIQRGNNRAAIFGEDSDYAFYLECLKDAAEANDLAVHAYVLMTNHVHLLATPAHETSIGKTLQSLGRRYVQYFNFTYQRTGTLWEGRYKATIIDSEPYLLTCSRYIELNPVRANMVAHPREYPWSSYHWHAEGRGDELLVDHPLYRRLGKNVEERQSAYRALFRAHLGEATLGEIREATNKGWALGSGRFLTQIEALSGRRATPMPKGRPARSE
ncbi:MAG: transposase [Hydrogenophilales bacterium]|nr:transposase [Hydrogenophilales bacterium]